MYRAGVGGAGQMVGAGDGNTWWVLIRKKNEFGVYRWGLGLEVGK